MRLHVTAALLAALSCAAPSVALATEDAGTAKPPRDATLAQATTDPYGQYETYDAPPVAGTDPYLATTADTQYAEAYYAQDVLKVTTSVLYGVTGALGLVSAINQPTVFGDGRCADQPEPNEGSGIGGEWGCEGLSTLHGAFGIATTVSYVSEGVTGLVIPGDEPDYGTFHDVMNATHIVGMVLTPAIGFLAAQPNLFGGEDRVDSTWPKVGRTIHVSTALLTAGAYWTTTIIEFSADGTPERVGLR
jgi:hypothetical protein